jgi:mono/diheme cytochrome c family protein
MRLRTLLLALVLLLGLAACGGGDDDEASDETTVTETDGGTTGDDGATTGGGTTDDEGAGDAEAGAEVFSTAGCGSCHVLAAANSSGSIGPDLDEASPSFDKVVERVTEGSGAMPSFRDQLSEQQIQDVAAYVSAAVED